MYAYTSTRNCDLVIQTSEVIFYRARLYCIKLAINYPTIIFNIPFLAISDRNKEKSGWKLKIIVLQSLLELCKVNFIPLNYINVWSHPIITLNNMTTPALNINHELLHMHVIPFRFGVPSQNDRYTPYYIQWSAHSQQNSCLRNSYLEKPTDDWHKIEYTLLN